MFIKKLSLVIISLMLFHKANSMELIKSPFVQDKVIPSAIMIGIDAASRAANALIMNKINEHHHIDQHTSIAKNATIGALGTILIIVASHIGSLPKLNNNGICGTFSFLTMIAIFEKVLWFPWCHNSRIKELKNIRSNAVNPANATAQDNFISNVTNRNIKEDAYRFTFYSELLHSIGSTAGIIIFRYLDSRK